MKSKFLLALVLAAPLALLSGCDSSARTASHNLSKAADEFQIVRRVVFYNGITSEYVLSIEGACSIAKDGVDNQLEVTCKTGPGEFKKHFLGLSDNVTYFAEQMNGAPVSTYHYKVFFKPQSMLPDIDFKGSAVGLGQLTK